MMNMGIGAMMHDLRGGSENSADKYYGRKIVSAVFDKEADRFHLTFGDGVHIAIWDNGQSCCENRYMSTDDDPSFLIGKTLKSIEVKYAEEDGEYGIHETAFVEITVDDGSIVFCNHNGHNGYYGGFGLTITEEQSS